MLLIRIAGILTVIVIGAGIVAYLTTGRREYLKLAGRVTKWALIFVLITLALMALERVAVML